MPATLNLDLVQRMSASFPVPGNFWKTFTTNLIVADRPGQSYSDWKPISHLKGVGGVYAILLPAAWFSLSRTIHLHAPHSHKGETIPFEFTVEAITDDGFGIVYVGRTSNLFQRWRGHLTSGERKDGGQVKYGLVDCGLERDVEAALQKVRSHSVFIYAELSGPEHCANRDVLEMTLCARFGPPFNIKSER
jgi:hypothetical protein